MKKLALLMSCIFLLVGCEAKLAEQMPDIVFVMSHHYRGTNIAGWYITKNGEIKIYDFRNETNEESYDIASVYNRLEEVTCENIISRRAPDGIFNFDEITPIPAETMLELYRQLIDVDETKPLAEPEPNKGFGIPYPMSLESKGSYELYGIRRNESGESEPVLLFVYGDSEMTGLFYDYTPNGIVLDLYNIVGHSNWVYHYSRYEFY